MTTMKDWLRNDHTYKGPASHVKTNGKYRENLIRKSEVLTDQQDMFVCPTEEEISQVKSMNKVGLL